jgi:hypothetical protein
MKYVLDVEYIKVARKVIMERDSQKVEKRIAAKIALKVSSVYVIYKVEMDRHVNVHQVFQSC